MGVGELGGFGFSFGGGGGSSKNSESVEDAQSSEGTEGTESTASVENSEMSGNNSVSLPKNDSQLKHIFGNRPGHLPDTPANRQRLEDLARDTSKYMGTDKYGNSWNVSINDDGTQTWVRYQNGVINEGGLNQIPKPWDNETGLNRNPFK